MPDSLYLKLPWVCCRCRRNTAFGSLGWATAHHALGHDRGDDFGKTGRATWHLQSSGADRINRRICSSTCSQNCQTSAFAIRVIKQSIKSIHETTLSQGLKFERQNFVWLAATKDRNEGINALRKESQCLEVSDGLSKYYC